MSDKMSISLKDTRQREIYIEETPKDNTCRMVHRYV